MCTTRGSSRLSGFKRAILAALINAAAPAPAGARSSSRLSPSPSSRSAAAIRANVGPTHGPVEVSVLFSLVVPSTAGGSLAQDLYLLWPGEVDGEPVPGPPDPEIRRTVEGRGFQVTREGRLPLVARAIYSGRDRAS
jgi:hypothetical protein